MPVEPRRPTGETAGYRPEQPTIAANLSPLLALAAELGTTAGTAPPGAAHEAPRHHPARRHADHGRPGTRPAAAAVAHRPACSPSGVHGIFVLGTTGEFYALDEREKQEVIAAAVAHVAGASPVYAGTGAETTREVVRLTKMAEKEGADGVSVITPYFIKPTQAEMLDHFRRVAESTTLPVVLYNNPATCGGLSIEPDTVARLAEVPNIVGIKDSSGDLQNTIEIIRKHAAGQVRAC